MQLFSLKLEFVILFQLPGAQKCPSKMWAEALAPRASAETIWLSLDRAVVAIQVKHFASSHQNKKREKRTVWCLWRCCQAAVWPVSQEETLHLWPLLHTSLLLLTLLFLPGSSQVLSGRKHFPQVELEKKKPYYFVIPFISGILLRVSVWWLQQLLVSHGTFSLENLFKLFLLLVCRIPLIFKVKHRNFF